MRKREYELGTLGWWMDERRGELGLTWEEVASRADVSPETLRRNANDPSGMRTTTKKAIERALRFKPGAVDLIVRAWAGGQGGGLVEDALTLDELRSHIIIDDEREPASDSHYPADLHDDVERKLWDLDALDEDERWNLVTFYRAQRQTSHNRRKAM